MQDRLVVYTDHYNTGVAMNWTPVNLKKDDLTEKALEIVHGVWGWTSEDIEVNGDKLSEFLIDPDIWRDIGKRIKWPKVADATQEVKDAITRCKISVYKTMKMHWSNDRAVTYARRSETHREEILALTRGNLT